MKKTLSILLAIAMLASLCTVPAWAEEDEILVDIPVIEEVSEEELEEEYELYGEEVELMASTVEVHEFVPAEGDGVTYLTELPNVKISYTGNKEASVGSIANGKYTTGTWNAEVASDNHKFYWYDGNNSEGCLGLKNTTAITIDLGEAKTFSGLRIYDSVRSRSYSTGALRDIKTIKMQVSNDNLFKWHALDAAARSTDPLTTEFGDYAFSSGGTAINITARYIKFTVSAIYSYGEFELEEVVMLDPVEENATKVMDTDITVNIDMPATLTAAEKEGVTMLSGTTADGAAVARAFVKGPSNSDNDSIVEKAVYLDGKRSGWGEWGLNTSTPTTRYVTIELAEAMEFSGVRFWMHIRNASWANGYYSGDKSQNGLIRRIPETANIMISDDGDTWEALTTTIERNETYWYLDMPFKSGGEAKNFTAKYIRIYPTKIIAGWGECEIGELALLNTDSELDTYENVQEIEDLFDYYRAYKFFSYKSGSGTVVEYEGNSYTMNDWNSVGRLFDENLSGTSYYHTAANVLTVDSTEESKRYVPIPAAVRTITVNFTKAQKIGGFRIYGRTDNVGGNPYIVNVYASNDGENYTLIRNKAKTGFTSSKPTAPVTVKVEKNLPAYKHYKFEVYSTAGGGSTTSHACYCELQVLKPIDFGAPLKEGDFIPYPAGKVETYAVAKDGTASKVHDEYEGYRLIDGVIINSDILAEIRNSGKDEYAYQLSHNYKIGGCIPDSASDKSSYTSESAYILYDIGSEVDFAGVRIYGRTGFGTQNLKNAMVYVSEDGINWIAADKIETNAPAINDLSLKFNGTAYNVRARYLKVECLATSSGHWALEELRLLNVNEDNETKTPTELLAIFEAQVGSVIELIDAIGEVTAESEEKIVAARSAYDALPDALKGSVTNYETLLAAEEALYASQAGVLNAKIAAVKLHEITLGSKNEINALKAEYNALPEEVKPFVTGLDEIESVYANLTQIINVTQIERNVESGKYGSRLGYAPVVYTLYVKDENVKVASVKYNGEVVDNTYEKWSGVNNGDGTMTFTLAGNYYNDPTKRNWLYSASTLASIKRGEGNYYVFANNYANFDIKKGDALSPDRFVGTFVRDVSLDNLGDHKITVVFDNGDEKEINLRSMVTWTSVSANPTSASEDAIAPSSSWKIASTNTGIESRAFDGNVTNGTNSTTFVAGYNTKDGTSVHTGQHIVYSVGHSFWLDLGAPTKIGGVRLYNNSGKENLNEAELYGSNDLETWTLIGTAEGNATTTITVSTFENVTYRYLEVKNTKFNGGSPTYGWYSEIEVLKPTTRIASNDTVSYDISEEDDVEFSIALDADETLTGVTIGGEAAKYTYENEVISIDTDYLKGLEDGTYEFIAAFSNGIELTLTVVKKDTSKVSYTLSNAGGRATDDLVLESLRGLAVKSVVVKDGNVNLAFTQSTDLKTINVARITFRRAYDWFALTDIAKDGVGEVVVTYEDDSVKSYYITIKADWLTTGEVAAEAAAEFLADEIVPATGAWKVRASSCSSTSNLAAGAFYKKAAAAKDSQHWHSAFSGSNNTGDASTAIGHYIDVDFGEGMTKYAGIRHRERADGSKWDKNVKVYGKAEADGEWTLLFDGIPKYTLIGKSAVGNYNMYSGDILFAEPVNYRYIRIHAKSNSEHVTADTIHIIRATARLAGDSVALVDKVAAEDAAFKFTLVEGAENAITVTVNDAALTEDDYTFEGGVLTIKGSYTETLAEGENAVVVVIDGITFNLKINKINKYSVDYVLAGGSANARGSESLYLPIVGEKTATAVKYGEKNVAFTVEDGKIVITRPTFRTLDNMIDMDSLKLTVSFEGEEDKEYTVNLSAVAYDITGADSAKFGKDEIVPDGWKLRVITVNASDQSPDRMLKKTATNMAWHTGYTGNGIQDITTNRHYFDVKFDEAKSFAGFRYYARTNTANQISGYDDSGVWLGATIYGRNAETDEWTLIKSQAFDTRQFNKANPTVNAESIYNTRIATVYFGEDVSYSEVRVVIDCSNHATAKAFTFLKAGERASLPEEGEEKTVNIKVTPTTGGNVIVNEKPSLGDNHVAANTEVTFTATTNVEGGFQYWIEANTGKILGTVPSLTVKSAMGKDIKAVFADPSSFEAFVSFYGRNGNNIVASGYVKKGDAPSEPSREKLYTTGYEFSKWVDKAGVALDVTAAVNANTDFYAVYEKKADNVRQSKITVTNGTVKAAGVAAEESGTFAYDTYVTVTANDPETGYKFSHFEIGGKAVSYSNPYRFYAPDVDLAITAVYVAEEETVKDAVTITIATSSDNVNGVNVAGFITTRYIPTGTEVIETGVIYVKDASYGDLTIAEVGKTSANGKPVKAAFASSTTSGQHKLSASYTDDLGIKAVGFITYIDENDNIKTIYTEESKIAARE